MVDGPEKIAALFSSLVEAKKVWCCSCGEGPLWIELLWFRDEAAGEEFVPFFSSREAIEDAS
jgi:hypothetical protein